MHGLVGAHDLDHSQAHVGAGGEVAPLQACGLGGDRGVAVAGGEREGLLDEGLVAAEAAWACGASASSRLTLTKPIFGCVCAMAPPAGASTAASARSAKKADLLRIAENTSECLSDGELEAFRLVAVDAPVAAGAVGKESPARLLVEWVRIAEPEYTQWGKPLHGYTR